MCDSSRACAHRHCPPLDHAALVSMLGKGEAVHEIVRQHGASPDLPTARTSDFPAPTSVSEAKASPHAEIWWQSMNRQFHGLETVRRPAPTLDNRYGVRRAQTSGTGMDKQHFPRDLLHRSEKSIRLGRSCVIMGSTCPFWSSAPDDQGHPHVSRWYEGSRTVG